MEDMKHRSESDSKRLHDKEQRFENKQKREGNQERQVAKTPSIQKLRWELDVKKGSVEMEEEKQSIQQPKAFWTYEEILLRSESENPPLLVGTTELSFKNLISTTK